MKSKKILIIIAAVVLLAAIICAAVFIIKGTNGNKEEQREGINLVDKYASSAVKANIIIPQRAANEGDSLEKTEVNVKAFEKFTLTEEEAKELNKLIGNSAWHLASEIDFNDIAAKEYWGDILSSAPFAVEYEPATAYYMLNTTQSGFITTKEFFPASSCEIVLYDIEDNSFYYIKFDI
ncbi:MAG: hypothetical protein IKK26_06125 [Clostridia bacterium]|nr:hypothetical protein [Clostridia bacterium]